MTPLLHTAVVVSAAVVISIGLMRVLAYLAFSRLTEDSTDIDFE